MPYTMRTNTSALPYIVLQVLPETFLALLHIFFQFHQVEVVAPLELGPLVLHSVFWIVCNWSNPPLLPALLDVVQACSRNVVFFVYNVNHVIHPST